MLSVTGVVLGFHPVALERHLQPRAADGAHVRRDAAARHRRLHLADRPPLGELGRRLGSHLPRRALGRDRRRGRRAPLPRHHELEPGSGDPRALVGLRGRLGRRPRDLGRDPGRRPRRRDRRAPLGQQRPADDGRGRAGAPARAGRSAAGATTGTRSSTAGRRACRGSCSIDAAHQTGIQAKYRSTGQFGYYHPTFLYEFVWDLLGVGVLLWIDRRFTLRRPALFALYVAWYTTFRTFEEVLRIDPSNYFLHMRVNFWVSLGVWILSVGFFIWWQFIREPSREGRCRSRGRSDRPAHGRPEEPRPVTALGSGT